MWLWNPGENSVTLILFAQGARNSGGCGERPGKISLPLAARSHSGERQIVADHSNSPEHPEQVPVLMAWSGGKDSALCLSRLMGEKRWKVVALLTTITLPYKRVTMHGVREELVFSQALSLGIPVDLVHINAGCSNEEYELAMASKLEGYLRKGVKHVAFGDIFLEEVRHYRERNLATLDMEGVFPLWGEKTSELAREFVERGFRGIVTCIDRNVLDGKFLGKKIDRSFVESLPPEVDPCGERGEFHTFVYDGPIFKRSVPFALGDVVEREGGRFLYLDLLPEKGGREERVSGEGD